MSLRVEIPRREPIELEHLLLDVNGTLTDHGVLIDGVADRLGRVGRDVEVHLLSADTFGTARDAAAALGVEFRQCATGQDKLRNVEALGPERCAAIGNGANDAAMLEAVALGIAVTGPEGASRAALMAADLVTGSILDALGLLLDARALVASLRP